MNVPFQGACKPKPNQENPLVFIYPFAISAIIQLNRIITAVWYAPLSVSIGNSSTAFMMKKSTQSTEFSAKTLHVHWRE